MAAEGTARGQCAPGPFRNCGGGRDSRSPRRVGHGLDLAGHLRGRHGLNLTPCVYPLLPITVSYFGGKSGQGQGRLVAHGLFYLAGLALTNSILGVAAALTGGLMGAVLQNPLVLIVVAAILVFFATSLFPVSGNCVCRAA